METLNGSNAYDCAICKTKTTAEKNASLLNVPSVLTIQLKRFSQKSYDNDEIVKLNHLVDYPLKLDLEHCLSEIEKKVENKDKNENVKLQNIYNESKNKNESDIDYYNRIEERKKEGELILCGVIVHIGCTISNGHYVAYVRCSENKKVHKILFYLCLYVYLLFINHLIHLFD